MDQSIQNPQTSTGRLLKTDSERKRSLSQERKQFIEEEYDVIICSLKIDNIVSL